MKNLIQTDIEGILFDFDGTLVDSATCFHYVINTLLRAHQQAEVSLSLIRQLSEMGSLAVIEHCFRLPAGDPAAMRLQQQFFSLWLDHMTDKERFFHGVFAQLQQLTAHAIPWGIVSNRPQRFAEPHIAHHSLNKLTSCLIWGDTLPSRKPQPGTLLLGCQHLNTAPQHTLYIGDTETDMLATQAAGLPFAFAQYGYLRADSVRSNIQYQLSINTPNELVTLLQQLMQQQVPS